MDLLISKSVDNKEKFKDESNLAFGKIFTDHMFLMNYSKEKGWNNHRIVPYENFTMAPCSSVLHYGQSIFEGAKAYKNGDDVILFRPDANFKRMNHSCERLCIPKINESDVLEAMIKLVNIDRDWIPKTSDTSLYIRPTIIATDEYLGVKPSSTYLFYIILSPSGAYYKEGLKPVKIYVEEEYVRAVPGGMGDAKTAGNYAASLAASNKATSLGFTQVLWLDGIERKYVEEVGSMNIFFVIDGKLITPMLNGSILAGITRDSVIQLAKHMNIQVEERKISIDEVICAHENGKLQECFGSGTAAVISPVGELRYKNKNIVINNNNMGEMTANFYKRLTDIQYGKSEDVFNWTIKI